MQTVEEYRLLHSITHSIIESKDFNSALEISLQKICESTSWTYGEVWKPSEDKTYLEYSKVWYSNLKEMERFRIESEGFKFSHGVGLHGRVWSSKKPEWINNVSINGKFPRQQLAIDSGIKSAVGIPVISDSDVIVVMVFLTSEILEKDK
ncbi:MAG: GAF domain-containing protein [Nitrospinae bacterium]|nr:GAF domain-containing protein [Nitrospinota bacterium]